MGVDFFEFLISITGSLLRGIFVSDDSLKKENLLLRHQLQILKRKSKKPQFNWFDRLLFCVGYKGIKNFKKSCIIFTPETLFKWHRQLVLKKWRYGNKRPPGRPKTKLEIEALILRFKKENRLWGVPRIHGELVKLRIRVSQTTVRNILARNGFDTTTPHNKYLTWKEFLRQHKSVWAVDFFTLETALLKTVYIFAAIDIHTREIIELKVSPLPFQLWVVNTLRNSFGFDRAPDLIVRDRAGNYGALDSIAGVKVIKTPPRNPKYNAFVERLIGGVQRECTNHFLYFSEKQVQRSLDEYKEYFNSHRPHQGLEQKIPLKSDFENDKMGLFPKKIAAFKFLGGLHHSYSGTG